MKDPFVVIVEFKLRAANRMPDFRRLIAENAIASVKSEAGCQRFDVMAPKNWKDEIILHEIYDDEAAFLAHLETAHYLAFNAASADLIISRSIRACTLVCEASKRAPRSEG